MYKIEADATDSSLWCYFSRWINLSVIKQQIPWLYIVYGLEYSVDFQL